MEKKIKNAIYRLIDTRDYKYSHFNFTDETGMAFDLAIRSLQAWEEVLQELEEEREYLGNTLYQRKAYENAIDIIKQKLAEIEE